MSIKSAPMQTLDCYVANGIKVSTLAFNVPLNHTVPSMEYISVVCKLVSRHKQGDAKTFSVAEVRSNADKLLLFLQGGPGFQTPTSSGSSDPAFLAPLLDRDYTVVFMDQRGTGLSTYLDANTIVARGTPQDQLAYLQHFRADSIVNDAEAIRKTLAPDAKWTLLGQSFGGFTSVSYMSMYPTSLKQVLTTGGLPPIGISTVDQVYAKTYVHTAERNRAYYNRFPQDVAHVWDIVAHLKSVRVDLPNGGVLSVNRFRHLGLTFGGSGGTLALHNIVVGMATEIKQRGSISYRTKMDVQNYLGFETNPLYFLFQEAIYCNGEGMASHWAAHRAAPASFKADTPTAHPTFMFSGEMVYPDMANDYAELRKLGPVAELIHSHSSWSTLYQLDTLKTLSWDTLPVVSAVYLDDQYVDYELSQACSEYFHYLPYVTNGLFHNGLRTAAVEVLDKLFSLAEYGPYQ